MSRRQRPRRRRIRGGRGRWGQRIRRESGRSPDEENRLMTKAFAVGVLGIMLCFLWTGPGDVAGGPRGISGGSRGAAGAAPRCRWRTLSPATRCENSSRATPSPARGGRARSTPAAGWMAFYAQDGTVRKLEVKNGSRKKGTWFVDSEGQNCFQYEGKDEPKCDLIIPQDGQYLRVPGRSGAPDPDPAGQPLQPLAVCCLFRCLGPGSRVYGELGR